jgi:hypothetical protein
LSLIKDVVWLRGLLRELRFPMIKATACDVDNAGVIRQSEKSVNHTSAKHYRIAQAFVRERVAELMVILKKVPTDLNEADIFTKALNAPAFMRHRDSIMGPQTAPI